MPLAFDNAKYNFEVKSNPSAENILKKYNIKTPYLISIGRLEEKKNTALMIKAFDLLKNKNLSDKIKNLSLVLVGGRGVGFKKVEDAFEESPYKNQIILTGWVEEDDLPILLSRAEIFLFPSLYEGFGLPILQAFACGVPVISSSTGGLPEVNIHTETGYIAEIGDISRMARYAVDLLTNESKHARFAKNARNRAVEVFDTASILPQYERFYENVMSGN